MQVAVCVITYRRPQGLTRLLDGLNRLTFQGDPPDVRCIVVDNDEARPAAEVCDEIRSRFRWPLRYEVEPRRGIPFARNKAVACAKDEADFIAFIDDDEVPEPNWLGELIRVQQEYGADVVTGPVVPFFAEEPPAWVTKGRFYERNRWATGRRLDRAFTGNILLRREVFEKTPMHFDERMATTGGSDSHFLQRVHRAGFEIVWADQAIAHEWVPTSRVGAKWILQRAYRSGTTMAFVRREFHSVLKSTAMLLIIGCGRIVAGVLFLPIGLAWGHHKTVACLRQICYGAGLLVGMLGGRYSEYRQTHGT